MKTRNKKLLQRNPENIELDPGRGIDSCLDVITHYFEKSNVIRNLFVKEFARMEDIQFELLVGALTPMVLKEDANMIESMKPLEMVRLALRYLASGDTFRLFEFQDYISYCY